MRVCVYVLKVYMYFICAICYRREYPCNVNIINKNIREIRLRFNREQTVTISCRVLSRSRSGASEYAAPGTMSNILQESETLFVGENGRVFVTVTVT